MLLDFISLILIQYNFKKCHYYMMIDNTHKYDEICLPLL